MGVNRITRNKYKQIKTKDIKGANNENFFKVEKI